MKKIISILFLMFFATICLAEEKDTYKSFAELYPERAKVHNIAKLGDIFIKDDIKCRVIGEAKYPFGNAWVQWIDEEPFDEDCDIVIHIGWNNIPKKMHIKYYDCIKTTEFLIGWCARNGFDFKNFVHNAQPMKGK